MKTYDDISKTPMWFHIFVHLVIIPSTIFETILMNGNIFVYLSLIFSILCFIGFWKLRKFAYYSIMVLLIFRVIECFMYMYAYFFNESLQYMYVYPENFLSYIIILILTLFIIIYYFKRRKLFTKEGKNNPYTIYKKSKEDNEAKKVCLSKTKDNISNNKTLNLSNNINSKSAIVVIIILALAITNVFQYIRTDKNIKKYHAEVEKNKSLTYANESLQRKYDYMTELRDLALDMYGWKN